MNDQQNNNVTWQDILGGFGAGLNSIFGNNPANYPPGYYTMTPQQQIMGMDKSTFYMVAGVGLIIVALIAYKLMNK